MSCPQIPDGQGWSLSQGSIVSSIVVADNTTTIILGTIELDDDTSATPTISYLATQGGVTDLNGNALATVSDIQIRDLAAPVLSDVRVINTTTIRATFTEVIRNNSVSSSDFVLDGASGTTIDSILFSDDSIIFRLGDTPLSDANTNITLSYTQGTGTITDTNNNVLANFVNVHVTNNLDNTLPTLVSAARINATAIILSFSENIISTDTAGQGWLLSTGSVVSATAVNNANTITLTISDLETDTSTTPTITYLSEPGNVIDLTGNEIANGTNVISMDLAAPILLNTRVLNTTAITVTFTESVMRNEAATNIGFTLTSDSTTSIAISSTLSVSGDTITLRLSSDRINDAHNLTLSYDSSTNSILDTTINNNALTGFANARVTNNLDTTPPTPVSANRVSTDTIIVSFNEIIVTPGTTAHGWSVTDAISVTRAINDPNNSTMVTLTITGFDDDDTDATPTVSYLSTTGNITDLAGNKLANITSITAIDSVAPLFSQAMAMSTHTIVVTVTENIRYNDTSTFTGFTLHGANANTSVDSILSISGNNITLQLDGTALSGSDNDLTLSYDQNTNSIVDTNNNNTLASFTNGVVINNLDTVSPTFTANRVSDDVIILTFDEPVTSPIVADWSLDTGSFVTSTISTSLTRIINLTITGLDDNTGVTPTVIYNRGVNPAVSDSSGNEIADGQRVIATDSVAPRVLDVYVINTTAIRAVFTETVRDNGAIPADFTLDASGNSLSGTTINSIIFSNNIVTLDITGGTITEAITGITLSYTQGSNNITDISSSSNNNILENFVNQPVRNNIDTILPTFTANRIDINTFVLTFTEAVTTPDRNGQGWSVQGAQSVTSNTDPNNGTSMTLVTRGLVTTGGTLNVSYLAASGNVTDARGNEIADGTFTLATDSAAPRVRDARVIDARTIHMVFTESVTRGNLGSDFVFNNLDDPTLTNIILRDNVILEFSFTNDVISDDNDAITLNYTRGVDPITDNNNNILENFVNQPVNNNIDTILPTFTANRIDINTFVLTFNEAVSTPDRNGQGWSVQGARFVASNTDPNNGTSMTLVTRGLVTTGGTLNVSYLAASGNVTDARGNEIADGTFTQATDSAAPFFLRASVNATAVTILVTEDVMRNTAISTRITGFTLGGNTIGSTTIDSISVSDNIITLSLSNTGISDSDDSITLSYDQSTNVIVDTNNNALTGFNARSITNNVGAVSPTLTISVESFPDFDTTFNVSSYISGPLEAIAFSDDGNKMFIAGGNSRIHAFDLGDSFDISNPVFVASSPVISNLLTTADRGGITGMAFSDDGSKMFLIGDYLDDPNSDSNRFSVRILEYELSPSFDISSPGPVTLHSQFNDPNPANRGGTRLIGVLGIQDIAISNGGTRVFIISDPFFSSGGSDLSTVNLPSSFTFANSDFNRIQKNFINSFGIALSTDTDKIFATVQTASRIDEYSLNPSTILVGSRTSTFDIGAFDDDARGIAFSNDGLRMFIAGNQHKDITSFILHEPFTLFGDAIRDIGPPIFSTISISPTIQDGAAKIGDSIVITVRVTEDETGLVTPFPPTINGQPAIFAEVGNGVYTFTRTIVEGQDTDVFDTTSLDVNLALQDNAVTPNKSMNITSIQNTPGIDATRPTFTAIRTGSDIIDITFSEPIFTTDRGGQGWTVGNPPANIASNTDPNESTMIRLAFDGFDVPSDATLNLSYSAAIGDITDRAGNEINDGSSTTVVDGVAPSVSSAIITDTETIKITFTEPISYNSTSVLTEFTLSGLEDDTGISSVSQMSNNVILLHLNGTRIYDNHTNINLSYQQSAYPITDLGGNTLASFTIQRVTNNLDTSQPTFIAARTDDNTIRLFFSERVNGLNNLDLSNWFISEGIIDASRVLNNAEISFTTSGITDTDATPTITYLDPTGNTVTDSVGLLLRNGTSTVSLDEVAPQFSSARTVNTTAIAVTFTESVTYIPGSTTTTGFTLSGVASASTVINSILSVNDDTVILGLSSPPLSDTSTSLTLAYSIRTPSGIIITDTNGNALDNFNQRPVLNSLDTTPPTIVSANRTSVDTITLMFSESVISTDTAGQGWSLSTGSVLSATTVNNGNIITLTISGLDDDTGATLTITYLDDRGDTTDLAGNEIANGTLVSTTDLVAPVLSGARTFNTTAITVTFTESVVRNATATDIGFVLGGNATGVSINSILSISGDTVILGLTGGSLSDTNVLTLSYDSSTNSILDTNNNNTLTGFTDVSIINALDTTPPTLVSANRTAADTIIISFNEIIVTSDLLGLAWSIQDTSSNIVVVTASTNPNNGTTITILIDGLDGDTGATPTISYSATNGNITDLAGNEVPDGVSITATDLVAPTLSNAYVL